jgi:hypothetical protein
MVLIANAGVVNATGDAAPGTWRRLVAYFIQAFAAEAAQPSPIHLLPGDAQGAAQDPALRPAVSAYSRAGWVEPGAPARFAEDSGPGSADRENLLDPPIGLEPMTLHSSAQDQVVAAPVRPKHAHRRGACPSSRMPAYVRG